MDTALAATALLSIDAARANGADLSLASLRSGLRSAVDEDPMRAALATVLGSSILLYLAERGHNPKVTRFEDALVLATTCLDVGNAQLVAVTPTGKAIAAVLLTFGPALAAKIFDPPRREREQASDELLAVQRAVAGKLDAILGELERSR